MAELEVKVPSPGESISEVRIAQWLVADGDVVKRDQVIAEVDSDKATLEISAEEGGKITLLAKADDTVNVGDVVAKIDTSVKPAKDAPRSVEPTTAVRAAPARAAWPRLRPCAGRAAQAPRPPRHACLRSAGIRGVRAALRCRRENRACGRWLVWRALRATGPWG